MNLFSSDIDFLHEVNSIPKEIRDNYIQKLTRGKLEGQKNFLFAGYVEKILLSDLNEWDRNKLLRVLKISPAMLACYKCRMLKKLREEYFGVERKRNEGDLDFAKRLSSLGMNREAKNIYHKLSKNYEEQIADKNFTGIVKLSGIYAWFVLHYLNLKNYKRFSYYRKKLSNLKKYLPRLNRTSKAGLKSDIYKAESYKHIFRLSTNKAQILSLRLKLKALKYAKIAKEFEGMILLLHQIGIIYKLHKNLVQAEQCFNEGIKLCRKNKLFQEINLFKVQLGEIEFNRDNSKAEKFHQNLKSLVKNFKIGKSHSSILQYSLFSLLKTAGFLNLDDELQQYEKSYCKWLFITAKRYESIIRSKAQEIVWLGWEMIEWHEEDKHYRIKINKEKLDKYFFTLSQYLSLSKKVYNINRLTLIYNYQADAELYRGRECNFAAAQVFTDKLERIFKTKKMQVPQAWSSLNKILIQMLEEAAYIDNEKTYYKYSLDIKKIIEGLKSKEYKFNVLSDYSKLNFIAGIFKVPAFTREVFLFEDWLKENRPNLFEPVNASQIENLKQTA